MANRFVLNETSYHGAGAIAVIPDEIKARGFNELSLLYSRSGTTANRVSIL